ncbi:bifunctional tetrahydrofolate synthase/dihydrofolate synthase [Limnobacter parvus]|uniref:Dihydrofolate synthase/folylpolyglutamate synthase n=1 Tax=Limnobacter parvus TaxID=2939690 RepID=A0ABT1XHR7_9BURK|nr:bifunctional tetrahydrofolate synthase/dihydrofolate synthase [Limnobacter parvus]MCR2746830.1 bifunctional tetrahydrofolate synthase/dihydrofolate synthase [Limnobacter parvus]
MNPVVPEQNPLKPTANATINEWLAYLESIHSKPIDMGLERLKVVQQHMNFALNGVVFTVAGTNGKGSTCAMLESILVQAGYKVGMYTSPHLIRFTERARINGEEVAEADLIAAFEQVEKARVATSISLTYFEFSTLAVAWLFAQTELDAVVLEVGLGGRLDAVNLFDTDCAICTSIDLDHQAFLGPDRESIGREKAGIFRAGKPAIVGDPKPPQSVIDHAESIGADLWMFARDFNYSGDKQQWAYGGRTMRRAALAYPALRGTNQLLNASAALAALESVRDRLPVPAQSIRQGFLLVEWPGRFQVLPGQPTVVLDVGHNPHAAAHLRESLDNMGFFPYTHCIFGILADKDAVEVVNALKDRVDHWHLVPLEGDRGRSTEQLMQQLALAGVDAAAFDWQANSNALAKGGIAKQPPEKSVQSYESVSQAYAVVTSAVPPNDRILVFGSFLVVAQAMQAKEALRKRPG